ncbi:MAG: hypothetical protein ACI9EF_002692 [Pseudohongiellaceae bacterium]|jgi:hypothetical protein
MGSSPLRSLLGELTNRVEIKLQRQRLLSRPMVVDVVLTKACNLA